MPRIENKKQFFAKVQNALAGFLIFLNGIDSFQDYPVIGFINIIIGTALFSVFMLSKKGKFDNEFIKPLILFSEAAGLLLVGYVYFLKGAERLPYVFYAVAAGYLISSLVQFRKRLAEGKSLKIDF